MGFPVRPGVEMWQGNKAKEPELLSLGEEACHEAAVQPTQREWLWLCLGKKQEGKEGYQSWGTAWQGHAWDCGWNGSVLTQHQQVDEQQTSSKAGCSRRMKPQGIL